VTLRKKCLVIQFKCCVYAAFLALQLPMQYTVGTAWMKTVRWRCQGKGLWWVKPTLSYKGPFSSCHAKELRYSVFTKPSSSMLLSFMGIFLAVSKWRRVTYILKIKWRAVGCGMFLHNCFVYTKTDVTYIYVSKMVFVKTKNDYCFMFQITCNLERV
jgi:hypothetical protein